jgi:methionyl-tRNA formyltransferase
MTLKSILFMGSPTYALPTLEAIHRQFPQATLTVFTRPDAPQGRSNTPVPTPIKTWAHTQGITVYTPASKIELQEQVQAIHPDLVIVIAYGMILPKAITDAYFCLNLHGSILPHYRGASPVQASLLNGDTETGISCIKMNEKMDEGPIVYEVKTPISPNEHFGELFDRLSQLSATACIDFLIHHWLTRHVTETPQDHAKASFCFKLNKADFELKSSENQATWLRKIKAFSPTPGAYVIENGKRVKILKASLQNGQLTPEIVQPEGKKAMGYGDYCLGSTAALTIPSC